MRPWVQKVKEVDQTTNAELVRQQDLEQKRTEQIQEKASAFWQQVVAEVQAAAHELQTETQTIHQHYSTCFTPQGNGFVLGQTHYPSRRITLQLSAAKTEMQGEIVEKVRHEEPEMNKESFLVPLQVNEEFGMVCVLHRKTYSTPESFAEAIVKWVCRMEG